MDDTQDQFGRLAERAIAKLPERSDNDSQPNYRASKPSAGASEVVAQLTGCLALVRPVGMTPDEAEDWLRVAAREVCEVPLGILRQACAEARRTCTHHAQIVATISKFHATARAREESIAEATVGERLCLPAPPKLTAAEFQSIVAERGRALSVALDRGIIRSLGDGQFELAA